MTADRQYLSIDFLFDIEGTDEVAVCGLNYSVAAGYAGALAALAQIRASATAGPAIAAAGADMIGPGSGVFRADYSRYLGIKIAAVDTNGLYVQGVGNPYEYALPTPVEGSDAAVLPQSTICVSLRSGVRFGNANYGRMYIPHSRMSLVAGTPFADPASTNLVRASVTVNINAITVVLQDVTSSEFNPTIITHKTGATSKLIAQVGVGSVIDTQRRRRNRLNEEYSLGALT